MRKTGLTVEQQLLRDGKLTASRVSVLMTGNAEGILRLWREMVGELEEENLDDHWPAQLGLSTEELNLDWYQKKTGHEVTRRGSVVTYPKIDWIAATLDGWDDTMGYPIEVKHVGGWEPPEVVLARYQPQLHWQMIATQTKRIAFSVIVGAKEPDREIIEYDENYGSALLTRATLFMEYVWSMSPPVVIPAPMEAPKLPELIIDMRETTKGNEWGEQAALWLDNVDSREKADKAEKELKRMMPADAKKAHANGVVITRNKAGSLSLRKYEP